MLTAALALALGFAITAVVWTIVRAGALADRRMEVLDRALTAARRRKGGQYSEGDGSEGLGVGGSVSHCNGALQHD